MKLTRISEQSRENLLQEKNRLIYVDVLKVFAIFAVILIHTSASLFYSYGTIDTHWWLIGNVVDSCTRWGVPILLMVSGAMLLDRSKWDETIQTFFRKRLKKILIPFLVWTTIYFLWINKSTIVEIDWITIKQAVSTALQGGIYYHLNFLYYLLGLYIVTPIIRVFLKSAASKEIRYFLILWFLVNAVLPILERFLGISIGVQIYMATGFIGYYLLGYYINTYDINKTQKVVIYILGIIGLVCTVIGTYVLTKASGSPDEWFYGYLTPGIIFTSTAIMVFVKNSKYMGILQHRKKCALLIGNISAASFGIYLLHPIVLEMLGRMGLNAAFIHPLIGIPICFVLIFLISYIAVSLVRKIPLLRNIF